MPSSSPRSSKDGVPAAGSSPASFSLAGWPNARAASWKNFLLTLPLCQADIAHWLRVGRLRNSLAAKVFPSQPRCSVAQCALDLGADLLSADAIFRLVARHTKLSLLRV